MQFGTLGRSDYACKVIFMYDCLRSVWGSFDELYELSNVKESPWNTT